MKAQLRGATRCGTAGAESLPPLARYAFREGDMPEIGHSSSSRGANAGSRGGRLVRWYSLTWPYVRMPFVVTRHRG